MAPHREHDTSNSSLGPQRGSVGSSDSAEGGPDHALQHAAPSSVQSHGYDPVESWIQRRDRPFNHLDTSMPIHQDYGAEGIYGSSPPSAVAQSSFPMPTSAAIDSPPPYFHAETLRNRNPQHDTRGSYDPPALADGSSSPDDVRDISYCSPYGHCPRRAGTGLCTHTGRNLYYPYGTINYTGSETPRTGEPRTNGALPDCYSSVANLVGNRLRPADTTINDRGAPQVSNAAWQYSGFTNQYFPNNSSAGIVDSGDPAFMGIGAGLEQEMEEHHPFFEEGCEGVDHSGLEYEQAGGYPPISSSRSGRRHVRRSHR